MLKGPQEASGLVICEQYKQNSMRLDQIFWNQTYICTFTLFTAVFIQRFDEYDNASKIYLRN